MCLVLKGAAKPTDAKRAEGSLASLGKEMPRIARRDMFARGKRDIQKCDMFARLTRYALRASKAHERHRRELGGM